LHPDLSLQDGALERSERALARAGSPGQYQLQGQGLQILPSVLWTGPPLFSTGLSRQLLNTMIYPAQRSFRAGNDTRSPNMDVVLGRTRARCAHCMTRVAPPNSLPAWASAYRPRPSTPPRCGAPGLSGLTGTGGPYGTPSPCLAAPCSAAFGNTLPAWI
jgi:hypothetical protein